MDKIYCPQCQTEITNPEILEGITETEGHGKVCVCAKCEHAFLAYEGFNQ